MNSDKSIEALEYLTSFIKNGYTSRDVVNWNQGDVGVQFRLGKAAIIVQGCWDIPLSEEAGMNFGITTIPVPQKGMKPIVPVGGEPFAISPFSLPEKKKAAWKFLSWMMEEGMAEFNLRVNNIPTRMSIAPMVIAKKPTLKPFAEQLNYARNRFTVGGGPNYTNISSITRKAMQQAFIGEKEPKAAFTEAAKKIKKLNK